MCEFGKKCGGGVRGKVTFPRAMALEPPIWGEDVRNFPRTSTSSHKRQILPQNTNKGPSPQTRLHRRHGNKGIIATTFWGLTVDDFPLCLTCCKRPLAAFSLCAICFLEYTKNLSDNMDLRLLTVLYFSVRSSRSNALRYRLPS